MDDDRAHLLELRILTADLGDLVRRAADAPLTVELRAGVDERPAWSAKSTEASILSILESTPVCVA